MTNIFISYRREDSSGHAGRLYDKLSAHFGQNAVFMDINAIEPGMDFVEVIENAVGACDILIAIIGRQWLTIQDAFGRKRLGNPKDFVRLEIETALSRKIKIIPVLVQGTSMPYEEDLPTSLTGLTRRNAIELSDVRWNYDTDRLVEALKRIGGIIQKDFRPESSIKRNPKPTIYFKTKIKQILANQLGVSEREVVSNANLFKDLHAEPLDFVELIMTVEEEFKIWISDEDAEKMTTVQSIEDYIEEHVAS